jgi:nucleotide-binding universal stress UspA family protein
MNYGIAYLFIPWVRKENRVIKHILLRIEEADPDFVTLDAAAELASLFNAHVTGLFLNVIPSLISETHESLQIIAAARLSSDEIEDRLRQRVEGVGQTQEIRRFEVFSDEVTGVVIRECRAADVFLTLAARGDSQRQNFIEDVLFQSGRHIIVIPGTGWPRHAIRSIVIGWNSTREAARAVGEALPYLYAAEIVTIAVVVDSKPVDDDALAGRDLERHLRHHGVHAILHHIVRKDGDVADTILAEARHREAGLIVIGGYSHSRIREWLLGGVTQKLLRQSPVPLLVAH